VKIFFNFKFIFSPAIVKDEMTFLYLGKKGDSSVADSDPWSGAFLTPASGISFSESQVPDPTHISESLVTIIWVKNT
jgi:hypothetical protein